MECGIKAVSELTFEQPKETLLGSKIGRSRRYTEFELGVCYTNESGTAGKLFPSFDFFRKTGFFYFPYCSEKQNANYLKLEELKNERLRLCLNRKKVAGYLG